MTGLIIIFGSIILIGTVAVLVLASLLWSYIQRDRYTTQAVPCPHGHEDWSDCPVCGH